MYDESFEELVRTKCEELAEERFATQYGDLSLEQQEQLRILAIRLICADGVEKAFRTT